MAASLTQFEMKLVTDPTIILTKNNIIQNVQQFFGELAEEYKTIAEAEDRLHAFIETNAKISKGENYKGLPYVILDFPRLFAKQDVFAVRTFFWWGNFFSITLHLAGKYQQQYAYLIEKAIDKDIFKGWYINCSSNAWEHHFEEENYNLIEQGKNYSLSQLPHLKIAKKIPLEKWEEAGFFLKENYHFLMKALSS